MNLPTALILLFYRFLKKEGRHSAHPLNNLNYLLK